MRQLDEWTEKVAQLALVVGDLKFRRRDALDLDGFATDLNMSLVAYQQRTHPVEIAIGANPNAQARLCPSTRRDSASADTENVAREDRRWLDAGQRAIRRRRLRPELLPECD